MRKSSGSSRNHRKKDEQNSGRITRYLAPRVTQIANLGLVHTTRLRFISTASVALAVTYGNLLDAILVASTTTQGWQLFDGVRIRAVEVWNYSSSGPSTVTVTFPGTTTGANGDQHTCSDTSMGVEPAYVKAIPSKRSGASMWQASNGNISFNLYMNSGGIVDVHLSYRTGFEGNNPTAVGNALVAGVAGQLYLRGLDGLPTASTILPPKGSPLVI